MTAMSSKSGRIAGLSSGLPDGAARIAASPSSTRRLLMNWDQIEGDWMQFKGKVRNNWVKLT
jgi:hypothetical protein